MRDGVLDGEGRAIDAIGGERVEDVGHGGQPPDQRDLVADQPARIPVAVEALVVRPGDRRRLLEDLDVRAAEHALADQGVAVHLGAFGRRQRAGLEQDRVRDRDLADIVQAAGDPDEVAVEAELAASSAQ